MRSFKHIPISSLNTQNNLSSINKAIGNALSWPDSKIDNSMDTLNQLVRDMLSQRQKICCDLEERKEEIIRLKYKFAQHQKLLAECLSSGAKINLSLKSDLNKPAGPSISLTEDNVDLITKKLVLIYISGLINKADDTKRIIWKHIENIKNMEWGNNDKITEIMQVGEEKYKNNMESLQSKMSDLKKNDKDWENSALELVEETSRILNKEFPKYQAIWNDEEYGFDSLLKNLAIKKNHSTERNSKDNIKAFQAQRLPKSGNSPYIKIGVVIIVIFLAFAIFCINNFI